MTKLYKLVLAIVIVSLSTASYAQDYWSARTDNSSIVKYKAVSRESFPKEYKLFQLNDVPLRQQLFSIVGPNASRSNTVISIPNASGILEQFQIWEASNFEPELQARFPEIRAYSGKGISDPGARLKLSISPQGIKTMVFRTGTLNEYIEPYSEDRTVYAVFKSQRVKGGLPWLCSTEETQLATGIDNQLQASRIESNAGQLKVIRLAQSCNGEYSNYFGAFNSGQVALVLAAFNATLARTNGCYENDFALHLNLIATTTNVIYYDPGTDPYTTMGQWNNQLQATLTANIGEANYDIGHMFGASGGGGNAGCIGCVCNDGTKGRGITSPADGIPEGDNFDIDYVAHEVGHQIGANHTFSMGNEGTGVNKEVGSGITIMGYAGITGQDVAPHSIDIFHEASIQQVQSNLAIKTCPVTTSLAGVNAIPVIAPLTNWTIPFSTPFHLTGSATDADGGDVLTYCWEQNDNSTTTGSQSVAFPTKLTGPNWLTHPAVTTGTRLMPRLSTILSGLSVTPPFPGGDGGANIEALSSIARTLNFRLTVRDNRPYTSTPPLAVGQTQFADMVVTVSSSVGPFLITSQNTGTTWTEGTPQTITWSVNGTTGAPTNTANVNILISTDGGNNFTMLEANSPNDGTEEIIVPGTLSTTVRIKVEAVGNIYFDINNANLIIAAAPSGFNFSTPAPVVATCPAPSTLQTTLTATYTGGFTNPITLSATGVPAGTTVTFGTNPLTTSSTSSTVTLNNTNTLAAGSYTITITGTATGTAPRTRDIVFTINSGAPTISSHPSSQAICATTNTSFSVSSAQATSYQWQVSTNGGANFSDISNGGVYGGATTSMLTLTNVPAGYNTYQYRAIAISGCGTATSNAATLTVNSVSITSHPTVQAVCSGSTVSFSVASTATQTQAYQWEVSSDGTTWTNVLNGTLPNGTVVSGANTTTLTLTNSSVLMNGLRFRARASIAGCAAPAVSNDALLNVVELPTVGLSASLNSLLPGQQSTLTATPSNPAPGGTITIQWMLNGQPLTVSGNTFTATVEDLGDYQVLIQQSFTVPVTLTCSNQSQVVSLTATASNRLFIFPTPNDGTFTVSYFNNGGSSTSRRIVIFDSKGSQVYDRKFNIVGPYSLLDIDLRSRGRGIYYVVVGDANGNKLAEGKVHVR